MDEEHDSSYKQEETPRYHGRDVAVVRGSREGALVVLGSATPSMETATRTPPPASTRGHLLRRRVLDRPLAAVRIVNMRDEYAAAGPDVIVSRRCATAIDDRLARQEQVVVLLNRRGYATAVFCRQCGDTFDCPNCSISLTVHIAARVGRRGSRRCPASKGAPVSLLQLLDAHPERGAGSARRRIWSRPASAPRRSKQQLRAAVSRGARSDGWIATRCAARGRSRRVLSQFGAASSTCWSGTQMIAKGHDFPRVTLVGVISADVGLAWPTSVPPNGRFSSLPRWPAAPAAANAPGEAIVQTLYPGALQHPAGCRQDYDAFFAKELHFRQGMLYPPLVAMVNVIVRGRTLEEAMQVAGDIAKRLAPDAAALNVRMLGPAPAPLQPARRASCPVVPEGHAPRRDASGAESGAQRRCRRCGGR